MARGEAASGKIEACGVGGPCPSRSLSSLRRGERARIVEKKLADTDRDLLRAMGLGVNARVRLCRRGEPCIVAIDDRTCECRIGLARGLADRILVAVDG